MIELYFWTTDNGRKGLMGAEESGLPYTRKPVDLTKREQFQPEFLKISPGHKIPALVDTEGPGGQRVTLCESGAILKYLAEKSGTLYPTDPAKRAKVDQWFFYGTSTWTPLAQQYGLFMHRFGEDVPPAKKHYDGVVRDIFGIFDKHLADNQFMGGSEFSIADISSYPDVHIHGVQGMGIDTYPNLKRWHDAVAARPAVQRAWA